MFVPGSVRVAVLRAFGARVGDGVVMRHRVRIERPDRVEIGAHCWIGENVVISGPGTVRIGDDAVLSQSAVLDSDGRLVIGDGAWVALRAQVSGSVTIGRRAVIGAAVRQTSDVAPGTVVGSPRVVAVESVADIA